jgi:hypothetical protein
LQAEAEKKAAELAKKQQNSSRKKNRPRRIPTDSSTGSGKKEE